MRLCIFSLTVFLFLGSFTACSLSQTKLPKHDVSCRGALELEQSRDNYLQGRLSAVMDKLDLKVLVEEKKIGVAVVDVTRPSCPRFAGVNENRMMYAASLPKIAILFGLFKRIEEGELKWDKRYRALASNMIRYSSNNAATELFYAVGPSYINSLLSSSRYHFYDVNNGGGLWVGKEYGSAPAWKREPLKNLAHAASAMSVARFYYMLDTNQLLEQRLTAKMKAVLSKPGLKHKFVKAIMQRHPHAKMFRKSGTWIDFHSDSALIERGGRRYIAVVLMENCDGAELLERIIIEIDKIIT